MSELRKYLDDEHGRGVWLANETGVTPGAVSQWADGQVPADRLFQVSSLTGIPIHKLRPDLVNQKGEAA